MVFARFGNSQVEIVTCQIFARLRKRARLKFRNVIETVAYFTRRILIISLFESLSFLECRILHIPTNISDKLFLFLDPTLGLPPIRWHEFFIRGESFAMRNVRVHLAEKGKLFCVLYKDQFILAGDILNCSKWKK